MGGRLGLELAQPEPEPGPEPDPDLYPDPNPDPDPNLNQVWDLQPEPRADRGGSQPGAAASAGGGAEGAEGVEGIEGGGGDEGGGVGVPCCTHTLPHEGMVYAVAMGEGYVLGGTVGRVIVWQSGPTPCL